MNDDAIYDRLVQLESQTMELAEGIIGTIAQIRARLTLMEVARAAMYTQFNPGAAVGAVTALAPDPG